ncbi:uncharacterized protein NESG_00528 [Nematocida ausubeli]|uniref:Uncharacterized protein n=1 Tax=Nematocida ausubeli (strain ATCC PRA-371 / ERTm2) TaxID=1913371 RepID=A0A086J5N1_NEMA1|nr:uncharacterized protein NESG_00528 [Nematocida ausubeli]KFG27449.1 hypothetical protein NESG_00528 [Nematocida ausubeli]
MHTVKKHSDGHSSTPTTQTIQYAAILCCAQPGAAGAHKSMCRTSAAPRCLRSHCLLSVHACLLHLSGLGLVLLFLSFEEHVVC